MSGTDDLAGLTARPCEYCGRPIPGRRKDARYCSTSHRVLGNRKAKQAREIHDSLVTRQGGEFTDQESLTHAYERSAKFASPDAEYLVLEATDDDENIYGDEAGHDDGINASWSTSISLQRQLDSVLSEYDKQAAPYLATQARNRGVVLPQLVQLKREYAGKAQALIDVYAQTSAMERADRIMDQRTERAHERQAGQQALREFASDMHRRGMELPNAGRATSDIMGLQEDSNPFSQSDREMYRSSGIARNMRQSGFGSYPGDARSWR